MDRPTAATTDDRVAVYRRFAAASGQGWSAYRAAFRGQVSHLKPRLAEDFVRNWVAANLPSGAPVRAGLRQKIVDGALADSALDGLGLVVAAWIALGLRRFEDAAQLAERAYAQDQHETFAQRIFMAAGAQSTDLRLEIDDWLTDKFCANPFTDLEVIQSGDLYTCCAAWLPARIGSAREDGDPWTGKRAQELRRSILDGDFAYCSRLSCPKIAGRSLPKRVEVSDPTLRQQIETHGLAPVARPRRVLMSYDTSCNLSCPSCRTRTISLGGNEAAALDRFYDTRVAPYLAEATDIKITGSGDPFGSNHFRHVLRRLTRQPALRPRLQLQTNGVLFDERAWSELSLEGHVRTVWVSVDATEPETYARLRRGGDFVRLMRNLQFLGRLRAKGLIEELRLDMVVQADNFRQMPEFADLARDVGADGVHFLMLRNWGTFSAEEYRDRAVAFTSHPDHDEFIKILGDPRLARRGIDLGNLAPLRPPVKGAESRIDRPAQRPSSNGLQADMILRHFNALLGIDCCDLADDRLTRHFNQHPADSILQLRLLASALEGKVQIPGVPADMEASAVWGDGLLIKRIMGTISASPAVVLD